MAESAKRTPFCIYIKSSPSTIPHKPNYQNTSFLPSKYGQLLGMRASLARYTTCKRSIGSISVTTHEDEREEKTQSSQHCCLPRRWAVSRQLLRTPTKKVLDGTTSAVLQCCQCKPMAERHWGKTKPNCKGMKHPREGAGVQSKC